MTFHATKKPEMEREQNIRKTRRIRIATRRARSIRSKLLEIHKSESAKAAYCFGKHAKAIRGTAFASLELPSAAKEW